MEKNYFIDVVMNKEKLSDGSIMFVAHCMSLGISSQGQTMEEAMSNIKEASSLYLEVKKLKIAQLESAIKEDIQWSLHGK